MCRVQTCLLQLSEIRDRLAWGRLALAQLRPQTGSGMSLQYSLPLCGLTTLLLWERLNHATDLLCSFPQPLSSQGYSYGCLTFTLGYVLWHPDISAASFSFLLREAQTLLCFLTKRAVVVSHLSGSQLQHFNWLQNPFHIKSSSSFTPSVESIRPLIGYI